MAASVPDWSSRMACIQTGHDEARMKHCRRGIVKTCEALLHDMATSLQMWFHKPGCIITIVST